MRSMSIQVSVCVRAQGTCRSRHLLSGVSSQRPLCMTAAGTVVDGKAEGRKGSAKEGTDVRKRGVDGRVQSFEEIPHTGRSGWVNLVKFWREDRFRLLHKHMEKTFNNLGPIYRNGEEWRADRLLLNKEVMMSAAVKRFLPLLDEVSRDFSRMLRDRVEKEGRGEEGRRSLTIDPSPDLFRFALEASGHVLYGERMGLFSSCPSMESQKFIWAVERMLATTPPLLYLPPRLLLRIGAPLWTQHATAWDHIFSHAVPLQFALFELGRNPEVQESVRQQVRTSWAQAGGDPYKALQGAPLLKGTIKEILRLYPVGITVQRCPNRDIVLQNYHIPAGTMVQACLYPLGRSADVFEDPQRFDPSRWSSKREESQREGSGFRSLAFGFGARQCVGRRIAENEMQLLLMHILLSFRLSVPSSEDIKTTYTLILQPETPPRITFNKL
ncbi:hypothetical protein PAMP_003054 [Pampus punctatissimus]